MSKPRSNKSIFNTEAWRYFGGFYRGRLVRLTVLAVIAMLHSLLIVPVLFLIKRAFDVAIPNADIRLLILIGLAIFLIRLFGTGVSLWIRAAHLKIIKVAITAIRESLLRKLYVLPRGFYTQMDRDQVHARLVQDSERLDNMANVLVAPVIPAILTSIVLTLVLLVVSPLLLLTLAVLMPLLYLAGVKTGRAVKEGVFGFQRAFESFSKGTLFVLHHMDLTRTQATVTTEIERQVGLLDRLRETGESMAFRFAVHSQIQHTLTGVAIILILVVGGAAVARGSMTLGEFLAFYVAAGLLNNYLNTIIGSLPQLITGNESMITLYDLAMSDATQPYAGTRRLEFRGGIAVESVNFSYGGDDILNDFSMAIEPGHIVALVGPNGAGKSTVVQLVLGFYRPTAGRLLADGIPFDDLDLETVRQRIGVVAQHPDFFSGTIRENICYGSGEIGESRLRSSIETALFDEYLRELPDGFDTPIGDGGVLLSGGQCQRLAIARALLREPSLLILDEPTNHMDTGSVDRLIANLQNLNDTPSILLISHDPTVVSVADDVYRLGVAPAERLAGVGTR